MRKGTQTLGASLAVLAFVAVACGDDSGSTTTTSAPTTTAAAATTTAAAATTTAAAPTTTGGGAVSLKAAGCPDPLIIQTDWFPEADHGWTYNLVGPNGTLDAKAGKYSGKVGDITVEIRAGGPFVGFSSPAAQMYQDPNTFMAYVDTGDAIHNSKSQPVVAVFASYDIGPQILYWDPVKYPDVKTVEDVGKTAKNGKVLYFKSAAYMDYLIGKGILKQDQVDSSYDGSPTRFVAEGDLFQQGYLTNEVYTYENLIPQWKKPLAWTLIHDAGFQIYQSALSVKPDTITTKADCLKALVPMIQQSLVDYMKDPTTTNHKLTEIVTEMAQFWQLSDDLNNDATKRMKDYHLVSDAGNGYVGDMDCTRVQKLIDDFVPILKKNNVDTIKDGVKCEDIVNNSFLDQSIGLGF